MKSLSAADGSRGSGRVSAPAEGKTRARRATVKIPSVHLIDREPITLVSPRAPCGWYTPPSIRLWSAARKRLGSRWASRTSNPASGSRQVGGGFDSHTLPPCVPTCEHTMDTRRTEARAGEAKGRGSRGLWLGIGGPRGGGDRLPGRGRAAGRQLSRPGQPARHDAQGNHSALQLDATHLGASP